MILFKGKKILKYIRIKIFGPFVSYSPQSAKAILFLKIFLL